MCACRTGKSAAQNAHGEPSPGEKPLSRITPRSLPPVQPHPSAVGTRPRSGSSRPSGVLTPAQQLLGAAPPSLGAPQGSFSGGAALVAPHAPDSCPRSCARSGPDQLLGPSLSVPAPGRGHCSYLHMERAVLGPGCLPRVPFPPKMLLLQPALPRLPP